MFREPATVQFDRDQAVKMEGKDTDNRNGVSGSD